MPITASCSNGHSFKARDEFAGKKVRCPQCSTVVVVGGVSAGGTAKAGKEKKIPAADPWDIEDPFEAEEPVVEERPAVKRKTSAKAKSGAGSGRKKKSGEAAKPPLRLIIGAIALMSLIEIGVLVSRRLQSSRADATAAAATGSPVPAATPPSDPPPASSALMAAAPAPAAPAGTEAAPASPAAPGNPMPPAASAGALPQIPRIPPIDPALTTEIAAYPFPPMTDAGYGPPAPAGMVISRALVLSITEMAVSLTRATGEREPPSDQMVQNTMKNLAKMRKDDPLAFCLPPAADEALLAGTANLDEIRNEFVSARTALLDAQTDLPKAVHWHEEAFQANQLSASRIAYLTNLMQAKLRKVQGNAP